MPHAVPRLIICKAKAKHESRWLENCCPAPEALVIEPRLPKDYSAWVHRCGWMVYLHEPTGTASWLHPVKLSNLRGRGAKDRELLVKEKNHNRGGIYVLDYGCPPSGEAVAGTQPTPWDFDEIDRIGYDAWSGKIDAERERRKKQFETESGIVDCPENLDKIAEWNYNKHYGNSSSSAQRDVQEAIPME